MKVAFCADDHNECTQAVIDYLRDVAEIRIVEQSNRWPRMAQEVGQAVANAEVNYGVVMCWTGTGTSIAANKVPGVRAALAWEPWVARHARLWNDANVLGLSLKRLAPDVAVDCVAAFLETATPDPAEGANIALLKDL